MGASRVVRASADGILARAWANRRIPAALRIAEDFQDWSGQFVCCREHPATYYTS